jgi:Membrane-associated phospholipid phosphatase
VIKRLLSARHDIGLLAAILVFAATLLGFAVLSDIVVSGSTHAFDRHVLLLLRVPGDPSQPIGPRWLEIAARDITSLGGFTVISLVSLFAAGYLAVDRRGGSATLVLITVGSAMLAGTYLKLGFDRPRPDLVPHGVVVETLSFPSSHAMMSAVTYLTLGALLAQGRSRRRHAVYVLAVATTLTLLIGLTRVYLSVHWPTDVLAGWCVGAAWAMGCWLLTAWWRRPRGGSSASA